jgi:glycosyltransferase involved in cell wall biosynthesis
MNKPQVNLLFIALTENTTIRGVERYCIETLKQLCLEKNIKITILRGKWQNYFNELQRNNNVDFIYYKGENTKLQRHVFLITHIKKISRDFDIVHYANTMPYIFINSCPTFMTIHDIAEYFVPEKYSFLQLLYRKIIAKISSKLVDKIVTVSHFSKKSFMEILNIKETKIIVTYNGIEHFLSYEQRNSLKNNTITYFGVLEDSKGIQELIQAFTKSNSFSTHRLLLIGNKGNAYSKIEQYIDDERIQYLGFVEDNELKNIISQSSLITYPSKYEGFGLPALEAFCLNDNILSSNLTSLGEVTKDFAWQVNPSDVISFSKLLDEALEFPKIFDSEAKNKILGKFSWNKSAKLLVDEYKKVLND